MPLPANKVSLSVVAVVLLLFFSAASLFSVYARSRSNGKFQRTSWDGRGSAAATAAASLSVYPRSPSFVGKIQSTSWDEEKYRNVWRFYLNFERPRPGVKYRTYYVLLRERPDAEAAMDYDNKDARRRWYESFLPSVLTDSGEPRLLHCCTLDVNGFLASLTRAEALALADNPGVRSMHTDESGPYRYSTKSCGFVTPAGTKRSFVRSRLTL